MPDVVDIVFTGAGAVFAGTGLFFAGTAMLGAARSIGSRSWIPVQGRILASDVDVKISSGSTMGASYNSRIEYEYEAGGRRFTGNNVDFSRFRSSSPRDAARTLWRYPAGEAVTVYHSPWKPERSVLEPGRIGPHVSGLILGIALTLFGTFFALGGWFGFDVVTQRIGDAIDVDEEFAWRFLPPFVIVIGSALIVAGLLAARRSARTRAWPTAEGTVLASEVVRERSSSSSTTTTTAGQYVYKAEVAYEYEVNGDRYVSNRVQLLDVSSSNDNRARATRERYNSGDRVRVYYDPKNPERAVLEPGGAGGSWLLFVVGAGFVIIASIMMWFHSITSR